MIRSMTGYGRKEDSRGSIRVTVEIRSVNHRFSEIVVRLPKAWNMLEDSVRKLVAQNVRRGRVDVTISVEGKNPSSSVMDIDWDVAEQLVSISREMTQRFSLETPLSVKDLLHFPGVIHTKESEDNVEELAEWLQDLVKGAAMDHVSMKEAEGILLHADLASRLTQINTWTREISQLAPLCMEEYKGRLQQRVSEWADLTPFELDPARVAQEVAFFADKSDISEELTRLDSHCQQFANQLGKEEAIGRKLDFLLQEMNREANTIASKANHLRIQHLAVEIKTELEKMREQVQNVE
ncbi:YicC/YloC family endoribonuclease [Brevibacillus sp. 179-C9.3 HS]|uniref:YicC/YloC family endoribonuclease n=1 Tax=unclassified Brevibacillus TaxID=2684853 RepID=UPI0039A3046E